MNVCIGVHQCVNVCGIVYRGEKGLSVGLRRMTSKWWTFVKVMVMDLGALSSTVISLLVFYWMTVIVPCSPKGPHHSYIYIQDLPYWTLAQLSHLHSLKQPQMFDGCAGAKLYHKYYPRFHFHCILCISDCCSRTASHFTLFVGENALEAMLRHPHLIIPAQMFGPTSTIQHCSLAGPLRQGTHTHTHKKRK